MQLIICVFSKVVLYVCCYGERAPFSCGWLGVLTQEGSFMKRRGCLAFLPSTYCCFDLVSAYWTVELSVHVHCKDAWTLMGVFYSSSLFVLASRGLSLNCGVLDLLATDVWPTCKQTSHATTSKVWTCQTIYRSTSHCPTCTCNCS